MSTTTDTELRLQGIEALIAALGEVDAERFITLVTREPLDYTEWQRRLWTDRSVSEISAMAMNRRRASS
ncbi:hypothetical protein [Thiorhodococcus minor]|uniref:Uncharacterized protein n=1 Tax=Thiorhodococcus minor TaxID=57489 RepID=A0A6M0JXD5_9GAMM|nr:hypothetical protein [Thiorhodococcus minor]NEV62170.1 hypothetical protein [Thiorhodococcus minor]